MQPVDIYGQMTTLWAGYSSDLPYAPMLRDCEKGEEAEQQRLPVEYGSSSHQEGSGRRQDEWWMWIKKMTRPGTQVAVKFHQLYLKQMVHYVSR